MRRVSIIGALVLCTIALSAGSVVAGVHHFFSRQRTCNRGCVPKHNYQHDSPRIAATQFAVANAAVGEGVRHRKPFHFRATSLDIDHLHLDQVGFAIYKHQGSPESGHGTIVATGRLTNDGGDGGIIGSNVTIRIRAYIAASTDPNQIPPDAFTVWQSESNLWVSRGKPQYVSLAPEQLAQPEKLNRHFEDITHIEVELEYQRDR